MTAVIVKLRCAIIEPTCKDSATRIKCKRLNGVAWQSSSCVEQSLSADIVHLNKSNFPPVSPMTGCLSSGDTTKQVAAQKSERTTDWVLVMVPTSCKSDVETFVSFSVNECLHVVRKDPEALRLVAASMTSLAKSEEPSAFQSRMTAPVCAAAMQALSAPPGKVWENIET
jgi:hypothetical protein